jgi:hypothetical protein
MVFPVRDPARLRRGVGRLVVLRVVVLREFALLAALLLLSSCGPSFEVLAEGDLRFVHCDRLDLDAKIAPSHRLHCWREWRRMYTYGQTRDRVEYAQRRIAEVVSGDTESPFLLPDDEGITARHRVRPGVKLDALTPAPAERAAVGAAPTAVAASVPAPSPEELACRTRCEASNAECAPGCETRPTGCKRCEQPLEACLADCKPATPSSTPLSTPHPSPPVPGP